MSEEEKKRPKVQIVLNEADSAELLEYLKIRGNKKNMAEELGVSPQTVSNWMANKQFPKYCLPFLKNMKIIKNLHIKILQK